MERIRTTPWGAVQTRTALGPDVTVVETAGHGGLALSAKAEAALPTEVKAVLMHGGRWAEQDCELPIVLSILVDRALVPEQALWLESEKLHAAARKTARQHERYSAAAAHIPRAREEEQARAC